MVYDTDSVLVYIFFQLWHLYLGAFCQTDGVLQPRKYALYFRTNFFLHQFLCIWTAYFFRTLTQTASSLNVVALFHTLQIDLRKSRNGGQSVLQVGAGKCALKKQVLNFLKGTVIAILLNCFVLRNQLFLALFLNC